MTSSQETLRSLERASKGVRTALDALGQIPDEAVPRVTTDGLQHELREVEIRLQALHEDLAPNAKPTGSDHQ